MNQPTSHFGVACLVRSTRFLAARFPVLYERWYQRQKHYDDYDPLDVLVEIDSNFRLKHTSQEISAQQHACYPKKPTGNIEKNKSPVRHFRGAGNDRRERAHDRNKASYYNRLAAVLFIKRVGPLQMAGPKDE